MKSVIGLFSLIFLLSAPCFAAHKRLSTASHHQSFLGLSNHAETSQGWTTAVIIDHSAGDVVKIGGVGDSSPQRAFSCAVARPRDTQGQTYIGDDALTKGQTYDLVYPIQLGKIVDWDAMRLIWRYIFDYWLRALPTDNYIVMTITPGTSQEDQEKITKIFRQELNVPGIYLVNDGEAAVFSNDQATTGTAVIIRADRTDIVAVIDGAVAFASSYGYGVNDLVLYMRRLLSQRGYSLSGIDDIEIRNLIFRLCYVAEDFEKEMNFASSTSDLVQFYTFNNGYQVWIEEERFQVPEIFFNPLLEGIEDPSLLDGVLKVISSCPESSRANLYSNIVFAGEGTMFSGIGERLSDELTTKASIRGVNFYASPDRSYAVFSGTSLKSENPPTAVALTSYNFAQGLDSEGGDLQQLQGQTPQQLKQACDANPTCVAFSTKGSLKSALKPLDQWTARAWSPSEGTYYKPGSVPTAGFAGYTFAQRLDSEGGDIQQLQGKNAQQLKDACNANPSCVAFNTMGWLKSTLKSLDKWALRPEWSSSDGTYYKPDNLPPSPLSGYYFYPGLNSAGGDLQQITGKSREELRVICDANSQCKGFDTQGWLKLTLKPMAQWIRFSSLPSQGLYLKIFPVLDGYSQYYYNYVTGNMEQVTGKSAQELKDYCDSKVDCVAFNSEGWMKSSLPTASDWTPSVVNEVTYLRTKGQPLAGYRFVLGKEPQGYNLTTKPSTTTMANLKSSCDRTPSCVGFTTTGWLKTALGPEQDWVPTAKSGDGTYVRIMS